MRTTADVVIIGGGIIGVSALYHLVENGVRNVLLVEMDKVGSGTTAYTAAWVWFQEPLEVNVRLSLISFPEFRSFNEKFGVDIGFRKKGSLSMDTVEHSQEMLKRAEIQRSLGVPTDILTASEIKSIAPFVNVSDIGLGLLCKEDAAIDHHPFMQAYIRHATRLGAEVAEGVKATNIVVQKGRVVGVETTNGLVSTPVVVNAAGIYDRVVGRWIGIDIPTTNALRHTLLTEPTSLIPEDMPMIEILNPEEIYIEGRGGRADFSIGCEETDSFAHVANLGRLVQKYGDALIHRMPEIADLGIEHFFAGIRSSTPDGLPILGPVDEIEGYINDCGWGGSGVSHAPAGGQLIAECILGTHNLPASIEPFLLTRFRSRKT